MAHTYEEHPEHALDADARFAYVMALALNPQTDFEDGVIRCVLSRKGDVATSGFIDRSDLYKVAKQSDGKFMIGEPLRILDEENLVESIVPEGWELLGFEDPDLIEDEGELHLYFTMPVVSTAHDRILIHLGHAHGPSLDELRMSMPALMADDTGAGAKEVAVAPVSKDGLRRNLVESSARGEFSSYSTIRLAYAESLGLSWQFGDTLFHPGEEALAWAGGHASPGPFLPQSFIDVGEGRLVGLLNGREADREENGEVRFGTFAIGLYIYNYEEGKIEWVSSEPLIRDSEARTITFASQFTKEYDGTGILYAHVDDAFVRAYTLHAEEIQKLLPAA